MTNQEKIKEAKHILKMLTADKIEHDEVNARIESVIMGDNFIELVYVGLSKNNLKRAYKHKPDKDGACFNVFEVYTTSLDACMDIMPEGWGVSSIINLKAGFNIYLGKDHVLGIVGGDKNPTIVLGLLRAILQAYIWEFEHETE